MAAAIITILVAAAVAGIVVLSIDKHGEAAHANAPTSFATLREDPLTAGPATTTTSPASHRSTAQPQGPLRRTFGPGTYAVGTEIEPGTYQWNGVAGRQYCGWLRLSRRDGGPSTIIAFNISHGRPLLGTVEPGDHDIEVQGRCQFQRVA